MPLIQPTPTNPILIFFIVDDSLPLLFPNDRDTATSVYFIIRNEAYVFFQNLADFFKIWLKVLDFEPSA